MGESEVRHYSILHLGAGTQSSAIYALMADGEIPPADYAVFADTQWEPDWVYEQYQILKSMNGPKVVLVTAGSLPKAYLQGVPKKTKEGVRFPSLPTYVAYQPRAKAGKRQRHCTRDFKIEPINRWIRQGLLNLEKGQSIPSDVHVEHLFGFSTDESDRAVSMQNTFGSSKRESCSFPLLEDDIRMSRNECQKYIEERTGRRWRSSRCKGCPLQMNHHWRELKEVEPESFDEACDFDDAIKEPDAVASAGLDATPYLHRNAVPLREANLDKDQPSLFGECEQGCFT